MILSIKLTDRYAERVGAKSQRTIKPVPGVNLLVGPNGSGKSSVLEAIQKAASNDKGRGETKGVEIKTSGPMPVRSFDFEKGNVRTRSRFLADGLFSVQVSSMFRSHGETNRFLAEGLLRTEEINGALVLLDEPDQALDFDGVVQLVSWLKGCDAKQMIVSVHHPIIVMDPSFNVIEMREGYREQMYDALLALIGV